MSDPFQISRLPGDKLARASNAAANAVKKPCLRSVSQQNDILVRKTSLLQKFEWVHHHANLNTRINEEQVAALGVRHRNERSRAVVSFTSSQDTEVDPIVHVVGECRSLVI